MVERFYCIKHLSTQQLRDLYTSCRKRGIVQIEYHHLTDVRPPELSEAEIILNIDADNKYNYFVFMLDHEDEEDGVLIGFGMSYHEDISVYLHLPPELLDEIVEKYRLPAKKEKEETTWEKLLANERLENSLN